MNGNHTKDNYVNELSAGEIYNIVTGDDSFDLRQVKDSIIAFLSIETRWPAISFKPVFTNHVRILVERHLPVTVPITAITKEMALFFVTAETGHLIEMQIDEKERSLMTHKLLILPPTAKLIDEVEKELVELKEKKQETIYAVFNEKAMKEVNNNKE